MIRAYACCKRKSFSSSIRLGVRHISYDGRNKWSNMFMTVSKSPASGATAAKAPSESHALLLKAGFVRQSSPGIFSMLPLGLRTLEKICGIIDQEMKAIGGQKLALPLLLSADDWKASGRWNASKGEFFRLQDRKETDMLLAPTHEEEITRLVASELQSGRQLPIRLYQIGRKFRDELRPRAGLLRGREFLMKDLYTFDATVEDAYNSYDLVSKAYRRIFQRIGLPFVVAEADSGNMGGSKSHEYHLLSHAGEDTLLTCSSCGYTANEELAVGKFPDHAPTKSTVKDAQKDTIWRTAGLNVEQKKDNDIFLFRFHATDKEGANQKEGVAAVVARAGRSINTIKIESAISDYLKKEKLMDNDGIFDIKLADTVSEDGTPIHILIDDSATVDLPERKQQRVIHNRSHYRTAQAGDICASCSNSELSTVRAVEVGHTFYLGTRYSKLLDCSFTPVGADASKSVPAEMGCYGIGISRLVASIAELSHDERGLIWPMSIAPYHVCIVPTSDNDANLSMYAEKVYDTFVSSQANPFYDDVIIDDRKGGFGEKMATAELVGYPFIVVLGKKAMQNGTVEINRRSKGSKNEKINIPLQDLASWFAQQQPL